MPRNLKLYIAGVVVASAIALVATTLLFPVKSDYPIAEPFVGLVGVELAPLAGIVFWVALTLFASAMPIRMPRGTMFAVSFAVLMAATMLGGPAAGVWVALVGTTEVREVRGRIPWYGTLANHAGIMLPTAVAGLVMLMFGIPGRPLADPVVFVVTMVAGAAFLAVNIGLAALLLAFRTGQRASSILAAEAPGSMASNLSLAPIGWLMGVMYTVAAWASLLFGLPLYMTRLAYQNYTEMREMFTETITALAGAVDRRDPFTGRHSWRVKEIAGDIGRQMRLGEADLEALEWGGLLHDVGKIGVPDHVLLKQEKLNKEERMMMNAHPVLGAEIIGKVSRLSAELPIIRHHHEWYNGSGYPDRLIGDEIPPLARILHVADSFEAMTAARPYRMTPLSPEQAVGELRKFAGIQFDPKVVDAFVRTRWAEDVSDPGRTVQPRPIPLISQPAGRSTSAGAPGSSAAPAPAPAATDQP
jgi:putative nucleotidyltransferase with HDIG domain